MKRAFRSVFGLFILTATPRIPSPRAIPRKMRIHFRAFRHPARGAFIDRAINQHDFAPIIKAMSKVVQYKDDEGWS